MSGAIVGQVNSYTLDTNCIIALEKNYPEALALRRLLEKHDQGTAKVRIVGIAASERQKSGIALENFEQFRSRVSAVGLDRVEILRPPCYAGIAFADWSIAIEGDLLDLEEKIHRVLFANLPFEASLAIRSDDPDSWGRWLNAKCDVLTAWCHIYYGGDILVTSDNNFHKSKKGPLLALGAKEIVLPSEVA